MYSPHTNNGDIINRSNNVCTRQDTTSATVVDAEATSNLFQYTDHVRLILPFVLKLLYVDE